MNAKESFVFCILLFFYFLTTISSGRTSPSVRLQENVEEEVLNEHSNSTDVIGNDMTRQSKYSHGTAGRGANGGQEGSGGGAEAANGGGSGHNPAGTAVIPLYAAGAAHGRNNRHHNAGSSNKGCLGIPTLGAALVSLLLIHYYLVF